jgi:hypothetical protein
VFAETVILNMQCDFYCRNVVQFVALLHQEHITMKKAWTGGMIAAILALAALPAPQGTYASARLEP